MNEIQIRGLEFEACHGVNPDEKTAPQKFIVDADIQTDFYAAAKDDDISRTVNYAKVCQPCQDIAFCRQDLNRARDILHSVQGRRGRQRSRIFCS